jgi:hypothetical protein
MLTAVYLFVSLIHLAFVILAIRLYQRNRSIYTAIAAAVIFGLFYDNLVIGIGSFMGEGQPLQTLNAGRFAIHALITPMLIMFAVATAQRLGIGWAQKPAAFAALGLLTVLMIALGVYTDIIDLALAVEKEAGTLRYINSNTAGPPIPAIITILVMIVVGAFVWRKHKWAVLCVGAILMFIFAGAGASILLLSNIGEVLFAGSILWTDYKLGDLVKRMAPQASPATA